MKIYHKVKKNNGRRQIYIFGIKVLSYQGKAARAYDRYYTKILEKKISRFTDIGINKNSQRDPKVIVSLTSFPPRMNSIHTCLYSLLTQSLKPDQIILWLSEDDFPKKEKDIPEKVLKLRLNGLTIRWCKNTRSYKKLIPTLSLYPNDIIVTADDDIIYADDWLSKLYDSYLKYPLDIQVHRVTRFEFHDEWVTAGKVGYPNGSFLNKLVGAGGVLYPPNSLYQDILNEDLFLSLAPTNDDQWFWFQAILNDVKIRLIEDSEPNLVYTEGSQEFGLYNINDHGPNLFWEDFGRLLKYYPQVEEKLLRELKP